MLCRHLRVIVSDHSVLGNEPMTCPAGTILEATEKRLCSHPAVLQENPAIAKLHALLRVSLIQSYYVIGGGAAVFAS